LILPVVVMMLLVLASEPPKFPEGSEITMEATLTPVITHLLQRKKVAVSAASKFTDLTGSLAFSSSCVQEMQQNILVLNRVRVKLKNLNCLVVSVMDGEFLHWFLVLVMVLRRKVLVLILTKKTWSWSWKIGEVFVLVLKQKFCYWSCKKV